MELFINNQEQNRKLPIYLEENRLDTKDCNMLKLILIEEGSVILSINHRSVVLSAPSLLCLNEKERCKLEKR